MWYSEEQHRNNCSSMAAHVSFTMCSSFECHDPNVGVKLCRVVGWHIINQRVSKLFKETCFIPFEATLDAIVKFTNPKNKNHPRLKLGRFPLQLQLGKYSDSNDQFDLKDYENKILPIKQLSFVSCCSYCYILHLLHKRSSTKNDY